MPGPESILVALTWTGLGKCSNFRSVIIMKVRATMAPNILQILHNACLIGHPLPPAEVRAAWRSLNPLGGRELFKGRRRLAAVWYHASQRWKGAHCPVH
jgi:hypothetical protein